MKKSTKFCALCLCFRYKFLYFESPIQHNAITMDGGNEVKVILEEMQTAKKRYTISWTEKADRNLKRQQKAYMKKHGQHISIGDLSAKLLETASL